MIFPSRAEGWGLPLIEAIACGLPVISTYYSGHSEYLSAIDGQFVRLDHQLQPISCPEFLQHWKAGGQWAVASPDEIAKKLVFMKDNYGECQKCDGCQPDHKRSFFMAPCGEQAVDSLQSLGFFQWQNIFGDQAANRVQSMVAS